MSLNPMKKSIRFVLTIWSISTILGCAMGGDATSSHGNAEGGKGGIVSIDTKVDANVVTKGTTTEE